MDRTRNPSHRYRRVWLVVTVTVVGLGWVGALMTRPAPVVFWTYVVTGTMAGLGAVMYQLGDGHTVPAASVVARRVVVFGAVFAAVFVALTGYVAMLGGWALVVLMPLPLTSPALRVALSRHFDVDDAGVAVGRPEPSAAGPPSEPTSSSTRVEPPRQACTMATQDLCHAWRVSYVRLQRARSETVRARIVAARQTYLDELARRNPDGFEAWLQAGARAASDPARFLGDTPGGDTPGGDTPGDDPGPGTVLGNGST